MEEMIEISDEKAGQLIQQHDLISEDGVHYHPKHDQDTQIMCQNGTWSAIYALAEG